MDEFRMSLPMRSQLAVRVRQCAESVNQSEVYRGWTRRHGFWILTDRGTPVWPVDELGNLLPVVYRQGRDENYRRLIAALPARVKKALLVVTEPKEMQILATPDWNFFNDLRGRAVSATLDRILQTFQPEQTYTVKAAA
jgi:hypothetical protein